MSPSKLGSAGISQPYPPQHSFDIVIHMPPANSIKHVPHVSPPPPLLEDEPLDDVPDDADELLPDEPLDPLLDDDEPDERLDPLLLEPDEPDEDEPDELLPLLLLEPLELRLLEPDDPRLEDAELPTLEADDPLDPLLLPDEDPLEPLELLLPLDCDDDPELPEEPLPLPDEPLDRLDDD